MSLSRSPRWAHRVATIALCLAAAACSSDSKGPLLVCPASAIAPEVNMIPVFAPGPGREPSDVQASGVISSIKVDCSRAEKGIAIHAAVGITARRATLSITQTQFPYFVAIADARQHILAKQSFPLRVQFIANEAYHSYTEDLTIYLPVNSVGAGGDYVVLAGFQLTPEQLDFMRTHKPQ